jgi:hypothetical protein
MGSFMKRDNAGSHGGKRQGAGRKPALDPATQLEIAIDYRGRMRCAAAAEALGKDPVRQRRRTIFKEISELLARRVSGQLTIEEKKEYDKKLRSQGGAGIGFVGIGILQPDETNPEGKLYTGDIYKPRPAKFYATPQGKGQGHWRKRIIADLARKYETTMRHVEECLRKFKRIDEVTPYIPPPKEPPPPLPAGWTQRKLAAWRREHDFPKSVWPRTDLSADEALRAECWRQAYFQPNKSPRKRWSAT